METPCWPLSDNALITFFPIQTDGGRSTATADAGGCSARRAHSRHARKSFSDLFCHGRRSKLALRNKQRLCVKQYERMYLLRSLYVTLHDFCKEEGVLIVDAGGGTIDVSAYARQSNSYVEIAAPQCECNVMLFERQLTCFRLPQRLCIYHSRGREVSLK